MRRRRKEIIEIPKSAVEEAMQHYEIFDRHREELEKIGFKDTPHSFSVFSCLLRFIKEFGDDAIEVAKKVKEVVGDELEPKTSDKGTDKQRGKG